jgi:uncharacterized protein HemY
MTPTPTPRPPRDRHAGDTVETIRAVVTLGPWLFILLVVAELLLRRRGVIGSGTFVVALILINPLLLVAVAWLIRRVGSRFAEGVMLTIFSARGTAHTYQYSDIESLIIRGDYRRAADEFGARLVAYPRDTEALIRLARLTADHLEDLDAAIGYLHRARETGPTRTQETTIGNALIDLHRARGDEPALRAELARFARVHRDTAAGRQALAALEAMRRGGEI